MKETLAINGAEPVVKKPFDLRAKYLKEEYQAVKEVLEDRMISGFIANSTERFYGGKKVRKLEKLFVSYFDSRYAVAVNSATSALHTAVIAAGTQPGDEVIVTAMSMSASASCITMVQARPVFVDVDDNAQMDVGLVEKKITPKTKAIIVVHLFGMSADMDIITELAKKHSLAVIEDCSQSPGTRYKGQKVGTIGDIGVFSFNQAKTISAGEGGIAITNNEKYAVRMQLMRNHAEAMIEAFPQAEYTNLIGYNYRMTDLEAAVAGEQFKRLDESNAKRIELANCLTKELSDVKALRIPRMVKDFENVFFLYPMYYDSGVTGVSRETFTEAARAEGVPLNNAYAKPLHLLPLFRQHLSQDDTFPNAERYWRETLVTTKITHHFGITKKQIKDAAKAIKKILKNLPSQE